MLVVIPVRDDEDVLVVPRDVVAAAGGVGVGVDDDGCGEASRSSKQGVRSDASNVGDRGWVWGMRRER